MKQGFVFRGQRKKTCPDTGTMGRVVQPVLVDASKTGLPKFLQIEPVGQCNLRCPMCPVLLRRDTPSSRRPAFLPYDDFVRIIEEFCATEELHLQGLGEPMMHPRFFDMVAYASRKGITVSTNSNLTLMSATRAEKCVTSGLESLHISIDGACAATYEAIRVGATFERVLNNVKLVRDVKKNLGSARPLLRMVVVMMRRNLQELPDLVRLASRLSIPSVFVQHLAQDFQEATLPPQYHAMRTFIAAESLMVEERVESTFLEARRAADSLGIDLRLPRLRPGPGPVKPPSQRRCDWPWRGAYISYQGFAVPCCIVATPDRLHLGNVLDDGVEAMWNGPAYRQFRAQLESDVPPEVCRSCAVYHGIF